MFITISAIVIVVYALLGLRKPGIAIITCPFVAGLISFAGSVQPDPILGLLGIPIFLVTVTIVAGSKRDPDAGEWPQLLARLLLVGIAVGLGFVVFAIGVTSSLVGAFLSIVFFFVLVIGIGLGISMALTAHSSVAAYVLTTLGGAIRQNLPLAPALEAAAGVGADKRSRVLRAIQRWLVQGYSLSQALRLGYPACPGQAMAKVVAGEQINQLPQAFESIVADLRTKAESKRHIPQTHVGWPWYPLVMIIIILLVTMGLATYVLPQFKAIMEELTGGDVMPTATRILFDVVGWLVYGPGWLLVVLFFSSIAIGILLWIHTRLRPRRPDKPRLLSRFGDSIKWHMPLARWFERNQSTLEVIEALRISLQAGSTVDQAIENACRMDVNEKYRPRLQDWLLRVRYGENVSKAAAECGLGSPIAWAFDTSVNSGNTLTILETLENFYRSNYSYGVMATRFILTPCTTVALGCLVAFVLFAVYSPGISVIMSLVKLTVP